MLKNTQALGEHTNTPVVTSRIHRTKSVLTNGHITILSPSRNERSRLENLVRDVWSRELLPFPGMVMRSKSESLVRTSASSVMRKLSVASIASSLSKRSNSTKQRSKSTEYPDLDARGIGTPELEAVLPYSKEGEDDRKSLKIRRIGLDDDVTARGKSKRHASFHGQTNQANDANNHEVPLKKKGKNPSWPTTSRSVSLSRRIRHRSTRSQDYHQARSTEEESTDVSASNSLPLDHGRRTTSSHSLRGLFW